MVMAVAVAELCSMKVMMAPASGFYTEPGEGKHEVRIAYVLNIEDLAKALKCLEKALEAYPGRTL